MGGVRSTAASSVSKAATIPVITNISITASTETLVTIPASAVRIRLQSSDFSSFSIKTSSGGFPWTVALGNSYEDLNLSTNSTKQFYIESSVNITLQIFYWTNT